MLGGFFCGEALETRLAPLEEQLELFNYMAQKIEGILRPCVESIFELAPPALRNGP